MPTNREVFFSLLKENNKYLTRMVIKSILNDANNYTNELDLYKNFDKECPNYEDVLSKVDRVRKGEPFQYVLGYANFIDNFFEVSPSVLIPRPETEELVIRVKQIIETAYGKDAAINIADVGTGSGCIGISLKRYFPNSNVYMSDIDQGAIDVAASNAGRLDAACLIFKGDMLKPFIKNRVKVDVLVSNPPYINGPETIDEQVWKYEPHKALLATPDTFYYEEIIKDAHEVLNDGGMLAFEIGEDMEESLTKIINACMPKANYQFAKDMYGKTRHLFIVDIGE